MEIAITGHRPSKFNNDYSLTSPWITRIANRLREIIDQQVPTEMISGMAQGIDTLWAELAIENNIPLICALPCDNQQGLWPWDAQKRYKKLLDKAAEVIVVCPGPYERWKMQKRNEYMSDRCDLMICVWDGSPGGTANCYRYHNAKKRLLIRVNPDDYRNKK